MPGSPTLTPQNTTPEPSGPAAVGVVAKAVWMSSWAYLISLVALVIWLECFGEYLSATGILLFAPPQALLLPVLVLGPLALLFRRRSLLLLVGAVGLVAFGYMNFAWHSPAAAKPGEIKLITHNIGQNSPKQFTDFVAAEKPDVILMQDARGKVQALARMFSPLRVSGVGEFIIASKLPVLRSEIVPVGKWSGRPVLARFELLAGDTPFMLYSVHLPTPRRQLTSFMSGRALLDTLIDDGSASTNISYHEWTNQRIALARDLAAIFSREQAPFLACGDFNTPDHGVIYRTVSHRLTDAHRRAGRGWGFTFPGSTRSALSFREPWLRLDYAFAGPGVEPLECRPEEGRISQHCAVMVRFTLRSS